MLNKVKDSKTDLETQKKKKKKKDKEKEKRKSFDSILSPRDL